MCDTSGLPKGTPKHGRRRPRSLTQSRQSHGPPFSTVLWEQQRAPPKGAGKGQRPISRGPKRGMQRQEAAEVRPRWLAAPRPSSTGRPEAPPALQSVTASALCHRNSGTALPNADRLWITPVPRPAPQTGPIPQLQGKEGVQGPPALRRPNHSREHLVVPHRRFAPHHPSSPGCVGSPTPPHTLHTPPSPQFQRCTAAKPPPPPRAVPNGRRDARNPAAPTAGTPNPAGGGRHLHPPPKTPQQRPGPPPLTAPQRTPGPPRTSLSPTRPGLTPGPAPRLPQPQQPLLAPSTLGSALPPYPRGRRCCRCCPPIRAPPPPSCRLPRRRRLARGHAPSAPPTGVGGREAPPRGRDHSGCAGGRGGISQSACAGCVPRDERGGSLLGRAP